VQHVSHFSHLGLIAFDFILLLGSLDDRPGLVPITGTVVAGHPASGRTIRNPVNPKQFSRQTINNNSAHGMFRKPRCSPLDSRKIKLKVFALTWCDGDGDGVCVAASTAGADVVVREQQKE